MIRLVQNNGVASDQICSCLLNLPSTHLISITCLPRLAKPLLPWQPSFSCFSPPPPTSPSPPPPSLSLSTCSMVQWRPVNPIRGVRGKMSEGEREREKACVCARERGRGGKQQQWRQRSPWLQSISGAVKQHVKPSEPKESWTRLGPSCGAAWRVTA